MPEPTTEELAQTQAEQVSADELSNATTVISSPKPEDLQFGAREKHLLRFLYQWHRNSAQSPIVLGQPLT